MKNLATKKEFAEFSEIYNHIHTHQNLYDKDIGTISTDEEAESKLRSSPLYKQAEQLRYQFIDHDGNKKFMVNPGQEDVNENFKDYELYSAYVWMQMRNKGAIKNEADAQANEDYERQEAEKDYALLDMYNSGTGIFAKTEAELQAEHEELMERPQIIDTQSERQPDNQVKVEKHVSEEKYEGLTEKEISR